MIMKFTCGIGGRYPKSESLGLGEGAVYGEKTVSEEEVKSRNHINKTSRY